MFYCVFIVHAAFMRIKLMMMMIDFIHSAKANLADVFIAFSPMSMLPVSPVGSKVVRVLLYSCHSP